MTPQVYTGSQLPSRAQYHQALADKNSTAWNDLRDEGKDRSLPMEVLLRKKCGGQEQGMPFNVLDDMLARENIYADSSWTKPAQKVGENIDTPFRANLTFARWDKLFHSRIWNPDAEQQWAETVDETVPGSIYRPYTEDRGIVNRRRRTPEIRIEQIVGQVISQESDLIRGNGFTVEGGLATLVETSESSDFPEVSFTVDQNASGMKKVGFALKQSRESRFRDTYMQTIDRVIVQIADLQATSLTHEGLTLIHGAYNSAEWGVAGSLGENIADIIEINTSAVNGYSLDTLIMDLDTFRDYVLGLTRMNVATGTTEALPVGAENRVPGLFGSVEVLNALQNASRIGYTTGTPAQVGIPAGAKLGFDRMTTLDFYQQTQGMVDEEVYKIENQEWVKVQSMIYGMKIYDRNGIRLWT